MPQIIEVPGHGQVEFPDGMSDAQIVAAIQANTQPQVDTMPAHVVGLVPSEDSLAGNIGADWGRRAGKVSAMVGRNTGGLDTITNIPKMAALTAGQVAGGALDVGVEGLRSAYRGMVPQGLQNAISDAGRMLADTTPGRLVGGALSSGRNLYGKFSNAYPDAAMALEGGLNIANVAALGAGAKAAIPKPSQSALARQYAATIDRGIKKAIRPSVEGKRTIGQANKYFGDAQSAVSSIIDNKAGLRLTDDVGDIVSGGLPKNLRQFSEAIDQTKRGIFDRYNAMAESAGGAGATVNLTPIADELSAITKSKPLIDNAPEVVNYAASRAEALANRGVYTAQEAQDAVAILNKSLDSFYKNPSYDTFGKAYVDSQIAQHMRSGLDKSIEGISGAGYQDLKRQYGALKSIERDVNRRMIVHSRQNTKGLLDGFSDVLSGGQMVQGLLSAKPAVIAQAGAMKGIARFVKAINDPDRAVAGMFTKAEKIRNAAPPTAAPPALNKQKIPPIPRYVTPMLPPPAAQGFTLYTPEQSAAILAGPRVSSQLGAKNLPGGLLSGGISRAEKMRLNALNRGLLPTNR